MKRFATSVLTLALMYFVFVGTASAQQNDDLLDVHLGRAMVIPGHVLQAGNYTFRIVNDTRMVEVAKADGSEVYGFYDLVPATRQSYGPSEVDTMRPDGSSVQAISKFFFPDDLTGYAFVYSKKQLQNAEMLAKNAETNSSSGL